MLIQGIEISKGLIIDQPWIDLILNGSKCWEMRSHATNFRGDFALIQKGTGHIVGLSTLIDSLNPLSASELTVYMDKHRVDYQSQPELLKWNTPWVLGNSRRIKPVPYKHKRGAVVWINL
ncbi:ASCH domain-containing protein [Vibrio coralliilyticus]|uniref:ASCH domain-containing protein n=1 Tax=Vibrio coralliilyticus TaxID=190893 RepID=A0AAP6ZRE0_9VIBR|nr:ASCH domain-containing protein [Vibrio coralliilyticus]NOI32035.1 ASCH domain-containing protein [Vibrio coralliilyticus]NOJ25236.1 ASCH domain-containing protein [Vibrio coralliilyticus]